MLSSSFGDNREATLSILWFSSFRRENKTCNLNLFDKSTGNNTIRIWADAAVQGSNPKHTLFAFYLGSNPKHTLFAFYLG